MKRQLTGACTPENEVAGDGEWWTMVGRRVVEEESDDINNRGLKSEGGWDKKRKTHTHR